MRAAAAASARITCSKTRPARIPWYSEDVIVGTFFNGGLRAYDLANPYQPKEIAAFVPPAPPLSKAGSIPA